MSPGTKKILVPFVIVDILFMAALATWWFRPRFHSPFGKPEFQVQLRQPESKLTEIDLINNGTAAGSVTISIDVSWPDADLVDAKGLSNYTETDTSRRSVRFFPQPSQPVGTLSPGQPCAIGWVKLTDNVPVHAEIADNSADATQP